MQLQRQAGEMPRLQICISLALKKNAPSKKLKSTETKGPLQLMWKAEKTSPIQVSKQIERSQVTPIMTHTYESIMTIGRLGPRAELTFLQPPPREALRPGPKVCRADGCAGILKYLHTPTTDQATETGAIPKIGIIQTISFEHAIILDTVNKKTF